jgi:hypothetical protein
MATPALPSPPAHPASPPSPQQQQRQHNSSSVDAVSSAHPLNTLESTMPTPRVDTLQGVHLKDFHLSRTLGTGSFGRVHLVQLKSTGAYYAMKVLKKSEVVRLKQVEHIVNEKSILERTRHPFLVNLLATFQDSVNLYMIMEYVVGGEMFTYLRKFQVSTCTLIPCLIMIMIMIMIIIIILIHYEFIITNMNILLFVK